MIREPFGLGLGGNSVNVGVAGTGFTATEYGDGLTHKTVLAVNSVLPAIAGGANLAVGVLAYTFPAGIINHKAARLSVAITQTQGFITADTPVLGLGTVIGSGAVAVLSGTATFVNILAGQVAANCSGTATEKTIATSLVIEASGAHTVYLNVADGWAASGDAAAIITGTITLEWAFLS